MTLQYLNLQLAKTHSPAANCRENATARSTYLTRMSTIDTQGYTSAVQIDGESGLKKAAFGVGGYAIGLILLLLGLFLTALLLRGMVWASDKLMPWLITASDIALLICIFILLPMSAFRRSRAWAGAGYYYASYVFGIMMF